MDAVAEEGWGVGGGGGSPRDWMRDGRVEGGVGSERQEERLWVEFREVIGQLLVWWQ